jgi:nucleoside diphosphate kinase
MITGTHTLFLFLGFVTDFTSLSEFYLLRELGLDIASCYAAATVINLPWALRPMYGYLSDKIGRRHIQLSILFFLSFLIWLGIRVVRDAVSAIALLTICEIAPAAGLTIADAYVVRLTKEDARAMPKHHRYRIIGKILASFASGKILSDFKPTLDTISAVFLAQALLFLAYVPITIMFLRAGSNADDAYKIVPQTNPESSTEAEEPASISRCSHTREVFQIAWKHKEIRYALIVFTVFAALPDPGTSVAYFLIGPLSVSPIMLAIVDATKGLFDFLGTFVNPNVSLVRAMSAYLAIINLLCVPIMAIVTRSAVYFIDDRLILLLSSCISSWLSSAFTTIYTVNIAKISPEGKEGGIFNGIISIPAIGQLIGVGLTYALTKYYEIDHDHFRYLSEFVFTTSLAGCFVSFVASPFFAS